VDDVQGSSALLELLVLDWSVNEVAAGKRLGIGHCLKADLIPYPHISLHAV
jgi:hypothetical protein